jgi:hypothetical protein
MFLFTKIFCPKLYNKYIRVQSDSGSSTLDQHQKLGSTLVQHQWASTGSFFSRLAARLRPKSKQKQ